MQTFIVIHWIAELFAEVNMSLEHTCAESLAAGDEDDQDFFSRVGMSPTNFNRVYWAAVNFRISREDLFAECITYYRGYRMTKRYRLPTVRFYEENVA